MSEIRLPNQVGELTLTTYPSASWNIRQFPLIRSDYGKRDFLRILLPDKNIFSHGMIVTSPIEQRRKDGFEEPKVMKWPWTSDSDAPIIYPLNYDQQLGINFLLMLFPQAVSAHEIWQLGLDSSHLDARLDLRSPAPPQTNLLKGKVRIVDDSFYKEK